MLYLKVYYSLIYFIFPFIHNFVQIGPYSLIYAVSRNKKRLYSFNNLTNTWTDMGHLREKFENIGPNVRGGVRCKRGYNYFFEGLL
jgi:hypothetical protein